jgi:phosphoribosylanthranilate isomerase
MPVRVKICGIKTGSALEAAIVAGADRIGLNFFPPSPRSIDLATAAELSEQARGRIERVVLVVDADDRLLDAIVGRLDPDLIQLHGSESPERTADIRANFGIPVMKVIKVLTAEDAAEALRYRDVADLIMFDAKPPVSTRGTLPGGNGVTFDWRLLDAVKDKVPYMLAGGLNPDNVAAAIRATGTTAVDVSSGVEVRPGEKDAELVRRFVAAAHSA